MIEIKCSKPQKLKNLIFKSCPTIKFTEYKKLLKNKDVKVNGKRVNDNVDLNSGDTVTIYYEIEKSYETLYEDDNVLVVDKKKGVSSDALFEELNKIFKPLFYIHRLDTNTCGVIAFAKTKTAESDLLTGFKNRTFTKIYTAEVYGILQKKEGVLTDYLLKEKDSAFVKIYKNKVNGAVKIITKYKVIKERESSSILQIELVTGKTHQIRAHFAFYGNFVIGDGKYGKEDVNKTFKAKSQRLISSSLTFNFESKDFLYYLNGKTINSNFTL